jgi:hypothetical protein
MRWTRSGLRRSLDDFVFECGDRERTLSAVRLGMYTRRLGRARYAPRWSRARELLAVSLPVSDTPCEPDQPRMLPRPCPCCGGRMIIIETFARGDEPKHHPTPAPAAIRIDTS